MRSIHRRVIAASAACLCWLAAAVPASPAIAGINRWTAIGADGANVVALLIDPAPPSTTFAATVGSGVLKSTDGGASWVASNGGIPTRNVWTLAIDDSDPDAMYGTLFAGTDAGVFRSNDRGNSWVAVNVGLPGAPQITVTTLAIDSGSPRTLYAITTAGLFKTNDGGASWASINAGLAGLIPRAIAIDPASPGTIYVGVDDEVEYVRNGVFKSTDAGANWTRVYTTPVDEDSGWRVAALVIDPRASSALYLALAYGGGLVGSPDGGASWSPAKPAPRVVSLAIDPLSAGALYAGTAFGEVFRTTDAGDRWTSVTDAPLAADSINVIALAGPTGTTVYAGARTGIYRSLDRGTTFTHLALGVRNVAAHALAVDPTAASTIYAGVGGSVTKTMDGGAQWNEPRLIVSTFEIDALVIDPAFPSTLYAGIGGGFSDTSVYKSTDAGVHWAPASKGLPSANHADLFAALAIAPSRTSTLYVAEIFTGVYKSIDGGASWTIVNHGVTGFQAPIGASALAIDPANAEVVYFAIAASLLPRTEARFFKSTNGADQWKQIPIPLPTATSITAIAIDPVVPSTLYASYANNYRNIGTPFDGGVLKSSDSGETWSAARGLLPTTPVLALAIDPSSSSLYAATQQGVFASSDGATSWTPLNAGLPSLDVWDISIDRAGTLLRAATPAGVFEYRIAGPPPPATMPLIEYFHSAFGHYFMTSNPDEIDKLDNGTFDGWMRTGFRFNANARPDGSFEGNSEPVCRFFSVAFGAKSSHFYTPFHAECEARRTDRKWSLESDRAFYIAIPGDDGACGEGYAPVYRLYNGGQGGAPNHRYTIDLTIRAQMIAQGWVAEGLGPNGVQMCSPP